jgi:hypothetical protein
MTLYSLASKVVLHQDSPVRGVIIDAAKIEHDKSTFARGVTYRTPDQLAEWVTDLKCHLEEAELRAEPATSTAGVSSGKSVRKARRFGRGFWKGIL